MTYALSVRKRALLACSLSLAAAGTLAGHAAGYALVGSSPRDALAHGYLGYAPQFLALCVAVLALGLRRPASIPAPAGAHAPAPAWLASRRRGRAPPR